ncbi:tetratricopeptide repeat protein [Streptomyces sp. 5-8]|uniref:Tetratricopeptide repeat protein n=1 Tax=Streptomyces musisoli TaxID=2802280 RepID=A0ABS1P7A5_9ACTN|nr:MULTISPECIES: tetratricopeptide repeat protein [Streptomyces]MBL1108252.1 tetratricopeptide repeat protein [Streptomyces musisoli]MBY8845074.1 ATP-binding protein [Streptomyces sp. SP2-10]
MSDHVDFGDGTFYGQVVGKAEYRQQAPAPTALDALPPRAAGFTGRDEELGRLRAALDPSGSGTEQAVLVTAVSGLGGIGKTALAVQAAYAAREAGWFPGGVLFVNLHGYDDVPVTADQALQSLLRALGVEPEHIPATADERAGLYRSELAEREAVLILADNASSPEQVRPLLPGGARHRVLVTSRDRLAQLGARLLPLDQLTPEAAYELLDRALRIAEPDDGRIAAEREAAARLAELCGYLPLALQIGVALLAEDPGKSVAELAGELGTSYDRLAALDDGDRSVRATFDLSYRRLPDDQARLLRLLAGAPGPEVSEEVAAVLAGVEEAPLRDLRALARAHLVERGNSRGCWRMHDLVRAFGAAVAAGDAEARQRLLAHYYRWADAADDRLMWFPGEPEPERFATRADALAWLDRERAGLVAAAQWGREQRYADMAVRLALCLPHYLEWRRQLDDLVTVSRAAQEAAHSAGYREGQAMAWNNLGLALRQSGDAGAAVDAHIRSRELYQDLGKRAGEAQVWNNLGSALVEAGRVEEAIDAYLHAHELLHDIGDRAGEAQLWNNLGNALLKADRIVDARDIFVRSCDLYQVLGDRNGAAAAWNNLGIALSELGQTDDATTAYGKALAIREEFEDWYKAGQTMENLALIYRRTHRPAEARAHYLRAADAYTRGNAPQEAAGALACAAFLTAPEEPTDTPAQASPPARTADSALPSPHPPDAPGTAVR